MVPKKFHIIFFIMIWNFSIGQQYIKYGISEGMPSNRVYRITQDKNGFIWAITDRGMARFNGKDFKVFNTRNGLPTNDIWDIKVDGDNKIWFFSKSSTLGYIDGETVHTFPTCQPNKVLYPASNSMYYGTVVFGNNSDWYFFENGCWEMLQNVKDDSPFAKLHRKSMKYTQESEFKNYSFSRMRNKDSILFMLSLEGYTAINLNTEKKYVRNFKEAVGKTNPFFVRNHYINDEIQITGFDFVAKLDNEYSIETLVKIPPELKAYFSMIDRSGNIWCATYAQGIYKLPQVKREVNYTLLDQKVDKLKKVGSKIIANVYNQGVYEYDTLNLAFRPLMPDKKFTYSVAYIDSLKSYFFNSETKNIRIGQDNVPMELSTLYTSLRNLIYFNGYLYANHSGGALKIVPSTFETVKQYALYGIVDILDFKDSIIMGTSNGLMILKNEKIQKIPLNDSLLKKPILDIVKVSDSLLLANTDGYGSYLTDLRSTWPLQKSEYLSVESAFVDKETIWLASEKGILKYIKNGQEFEFSDILDENDGLPSKKVNSILKIGNNILVSTDNGVIILPMQPKDETQLLKIYVEKAQYNQEELSFEKPSVLYASNNSIDFSIATIDFSLSQPGLKYVYRLLPIQKEWIQTTSSSLNFSSLPPNDYTLELKAGELTNTAHFTILPLWWQIPLAKAMFWLVGLLCMGLILHYFRNREISRKTAKLTAQKKMAEYELYALRAQMNPHFVFNSLAAIQYYINNNDFETSEKYLVKFSKLIRQFFELSKEGEIALDTEIKLLRNYLDIEKLRFKEKLEYQIKLDPALNIQETTIPSMLLQPIVENAVNHGIFNKEKNGRIDLNFFKHNEKEFVVEIMDNGVGFVNSKKKLNRKINSSAVLQNRLSVLNRSKQWEIQYSHAELFPERTDVGNIAIFKIKKML